MLHACLTVICLMLIVLTLGCASGPRAEGVPQAKVDADYAECESMSYVSTAGIRSEDAADEERQKLIDACMRQKGYHVQ